MAAPQELFINAANLSYVLTEEQRTALRAFVGGQDLSKTFQTTFSRFFPGGSS